MYSLVSSAVLAQDLLRHPYAARLAEAVDRVLALTPDDLVALGAPAPEPVRRRVLEACAAPSHPSPAQAPSGESRGQEQARAVDVLDGALLGSLHDLHDLLLREEPLRSAPTGARQVAVDAVAAAWAGPAAGLSDVGILLHPWESVLPPVGPPLGVGGPALRDLLDQVVTRTPEQWARTVAAHQARRSRSAGWSTAMHEACRVAWAEGRLLDVARAQLAAVRALALTRTGAPTSAVSMAVTAAVQALCTADALDERTRAALLGDWEAGS